MINDILDLSKLEAGRLEAHCEVLDVHASVERVIASMQAIAGAKKLPLHFQPFRQINTGQLASALVKGIAGVTSGCGIADTPGTIS